MDVLRRDERDAGLLGELDEVAVARLLVVEFGVILEFEEEVPLAEDFFVLARDGLGLVELVHGERLADFTLRAARQADEPLAVLAEEVLVDAGFVIEALEVGDGGEFEEVAVALFGFAEEHQLVLAVVDARPLVGVLLERDVGTLADDGLDVLLLALLDEFDHPVHRPVVRDGDRVHSGVFGSLHQLIQLREGLEEAVVGMDVEVDEGGGHCFFTIPVPSL